MFFKRRNFDLRVESLLFGRRVFVVLKGVQVLKMIKISDTREQVQQVDSMQQRKNQIRSPYMFKSD